MEIAISDKYPTCKILRINTYSHLKKFIVQFFKSDEDGNIRVDKHSSLGVVMSEILRNPKKVNLKEVDRYNTTISLSLNKELSEISMTNRIALRFNSQMDILFKEHFRQWIIAKVDEGVNASEAIRKFKSKYGVNESDYSFENIYRDWTRYKNDEYYRLKTA